MEKEFRFFTREKMHKSKFSKSSDVGETSPPLIMMFKLVQIRYEVFPKEDLPVDQFLRRTLMVSIRDPNLFGTDFQDRQLFYFMPATASHLSRLGFYACGNRVYRIERHAF